MKSKHDAVLDYTPCRVNELYYDCKDEIAIGSFEADVFRLCGPSRTMWLMLDGKNSIAAIVNRLCDDFGIDDFNGMCADVVAILSRLQHRMAIIANWCPLYKDELCQELYGDE